MTATTIRNLPLYGAQPMPRSKGRFVRLDPRIATQYDHFAGLTAVGFLVADALSKGLDADFTGGAVTCASHAHTCVRENEACMTGVSPQWAMDAYRNWKLLGLPSRTWLDFYKVASFSRGAA